MKVLPFKIPNAQSDTFLCRTHEYPLILNRPHQHHEVQITLVIAGKGTFLLGEHVGRFSQGNLFAIGAGMPHVFKCDEEDSDSTISTKLIHLFFDLDVLKKNLLSLAEFFELQVFFDNIQRGMALKNFSEEINHLFQNLAQAKKTEKALLAIKLLTEISRVTDIKFISSTAQSFNLRESDSRRLNAVFEFTLKEYARSISLEEVAKIATMSTSAFCRFFKLRTRKTYVSFLNEVRVAQACKMLSQGDMKVAEVCYKTGFNNVSNFNRHFKKMIGFTPREYQKAI